jgi:hypothetical protein
MFGNVGAMSRSDMVARDLVKADRLAGGVVGRFQASERKKLLGFDRSRAARCALLCLIHFFSQDQGTLVDLGFAFSLLMHCFMLSFFRKCSDGNAARKEHGADIISSNFSPRGISVTSLPHKMSSCEFPTWQPCFVSSRLDQNPSTAERMPSIQAAAWRHGHFTLKP